MDRIHFKTFYFKTEPSGFQAEPLEIFYKSQREVTVRMTDDILSFDTICSITPCVTRGGSPPSSHSLVRPSPYLLLLSCKKRRWVLSVISAWVSPQIPKSWFLLPLLPLRNLRAGLYLTLFKIYLGRYGLKDCKLAICTRTAAAGSRSPEPRLSLAPPHWICPL